MILVHVLPLAVEAPARVLVELLDDIPHLDSADRIALRHRQRGKQVQSDDHRPELADRVIRIRRNFRCFVTTAATALGIFALAVLRLLYSYISNAHFPKIDLTGGMTEPR